MNYEIFSDVFIGFNGTIFDNNKKIMDLHPYYQKQMEGQLKEFSNLHIIELPLEEYIDLTHFYGHWPFAHRYDTLSRVRHIEDLIHDGSSFLIGVDGRNFIKDRFEEECKLFRIKNKVFFPDSSVLFKVKKLIYPHWIYRLGVGNESPVQFTEDSFFYCKNKYKEHFKESENKYKLFLTRYNMKRGIINFEETHDFFKSNGFVIVDGSEDLKTTTDYFYNAIDIVGIHGGLFSNLIFCNQVNKIIEIFPHEYFNGCFFGWKRFLNIKRDYKAIIHESVDRKISFTQEDLINLISEVSSESN